VVDAEKSWDFHPNWLTETIVVTHCQVKYSNIDFGYGINLYYQNFVGVNSLNYSMFDSVGIM